MDAQNKQEIQTYCPTGLDSAPLILDSHQGAMFQECLTPICSLLCISPASSADWPPWAFVRSKSFSVIVVSVNPAFIWYPWCVQNGPGTTLKNHWRQSAVKGLRTLPGNQHHPTWHEAGCAHRWKPQINVNKSAGRGSWGCWRLSSIYLNQGQRRRQPRRLDRVSQASKWGWMWQVTETGLFLLPTPIPCQEGGLCAKKQRSQWSPEFKTWFFKNRDFKGLQSKRRW